MQEKMFKKPDLDKLVNGLQDLVYITDPERKITYANQAFADIFNYPNPHDLIGKPISDLYVDPEHRILLENSMRKRGGGVINYFVWVKRSSGDPFCLSVDSNWINSTESKGIEGTGRELTELVDFLGAFFQTDPQDMLTFCSPMFAQLFGCKGPEFLIGSNIQDLLSETRPFVEICKQAISRSDGRCLLNAKRSSEEGGFLPMRIMMNVSPIDQGVRGSVQTVGYQGIFEDVTVVEEAHVELEETHRILELLMARSQDGVYVIQGANLKFVNSAFCSIVERSKDELLGTSYLELIHPDDRAKVRNEIERGLAGEERPPYNFRILTKMGREHIVRSSSGHSTIRKVDSVYGYLRDITDEVHHEEELRRKIEERTQTLKEALDDKKALLDTVVHEVDGPTGAIRGIVERLISGIAAETMPIPKQLTKLRDIDELCQLIFMLARNVSLAESEDIRRVGDVKYWHLERELIHKAVNFMRPLLRNRGLPLDRTQVHLRGVPCYIRVNGDLFLQVFLNLLNNAIKYANEDPNQFRIEIKSNYSISRGLILHFSDWGVGIPEGESKMIFEKGKKGSNAINSPGMGLGLSVARRILNAYGCEIWVEKRLKPTTFVIKMPNELLADKILKGGIS